jgi:alpha-glucosidase
MTNWTSRDLSVPLSFLGPGKWNAKIFADGPNANQNAKDLSIQTKQVTAVDTLPLHLASGGGAAVIFSPAK